MQNLRKRIRAGGEDFVGFEGECEFTQEDLDKLPKVGCCLCGRLEEVDGEYLCDGKRKCPFIKELQKGIYVDCVEF